MPGFPLENGSYPFTLYPVLCPVLCTCGTGAQNRTVIHRHPHPLRKSNPWHCYPVLSIGPCTPHFRIMTKHTKYQGIFTYYSKIQGKKAGNKGHEKTPGVPGFLSQSLSSEIIQPYVFSGWVFLPFGIGFLIQVMVHLRKDRLNLPDLHRVT